MSQNKGAGGQDTCLGAGRCDHTDGIASVTDGEAGARIKDMPEAFPLNSYVSAVIAGSGHGTVADGYAGPARVRIAGILESDTPRATLGRGA